MRGWTERRIVVVCFVREFPLQTEQSPDPNGHLETFALFPQIHFPFVSKPSLEWRRGFNVQCDLALMIN